MADLRRGLAKGLYGFAKGLSDSQQAELEFKKEMYKEGFKRRLALEDEERKNQSAMEMEVFKAGIETPKEQRERELFEIEESERQRFTEQTPARQKALGFVTRYHPEKLTDIGAKLGGAYTTPKGKELVSSLGLPGIQKSQLDISTNLREKFIQESKVFRDVADSYTRIQQSVKEPSAAGDLALIFNYMKILDPGSTVREGEFATAQNSAGIPERLRGLYNRTISGKRLSDEQRNDFSTRAELLFEGKNKEHQVLEHEYKRLAKEYGVSPSKVIISYKKPSLSTSSKANTNKPLVVYKVTRK